MSSTLRRVRCRLGAVLVCATVGSLLAGCSSADRAPASLAPTVACTAGQFGVQDRQASTYLGLTEARARAQATSQGRQVDVLGQDGRCKAHMDLNLSSIRVQIYLEHGKVTWSRIG